MKNHINAVCVRASNIKRQQFEKCTLCGGTQHTCGHIKNKKKKIVSPHEYVFCLWVSHKRKFTSLDNNNDSDTCPVGENVSELFASQRSVDHKQKKKNERMRITLKF